tara:strand:- start:23 stop:1198 length:1176 start_codon:yes stop_codon:yes gene_type:complete
MANSKLTGLTEATSLATTDEIYAVAGGNSRRASVQTLLKTEASLVTITGGTINGTVIGGTTAAAGTFTALSVDGGTIKLDGDYPVGTSNVALGDTALGSLTTGSKNVAIGSGALTANTSGDENTATGFRALYANTSGFANVALGYAALYNNTTGNYNVATGQRALYANTTASYNTANGWYALYANTTGANNTANGYLALRTNTTGGSNTANGFAALTSNTTGSNNAASGYQALTSNTTGSGNIGIGFRNNAGTYAPVFDPTTENNRIVMGHTSVTNAYVQVAWTVVSDARDKTAFAPVYYGLDFVNAMKPTEYQFKAGGRDGEADGIRRYGFLAQDVLALEGDNPVLVDAEDPDKLKLKESNIIPVLVKAIQELSAKNDALTARIAALEGA